MRFPHDPGDLAMIGRAKRPVIPGVLGNVLASVFHQRPVHGCGLGQVENVSELLQRASGDPFARVLFPEPEKNGVFGGHGIPIKDIQKISKGIAHGNSHVAVSADEDRREGM
jgi:hypothetical protein